MSIAPHDTGIGIRRRFTTAGVDPYDMVRWERRDARITNFRDGSVAFEQLGVEVPAPWSLNATNILAQKYFRGTLGTPEREWSLKQVADRIVDTITRWGREGGYFADEEEASAFSDELKYLIITQRAAFNSPVWFNIGVAGVPQQGSACQPYHALVNTPEGPVPIGRLVEDGAVGAKLFDAKGITVIEAVKRNGRKPVLRIHTKAGHQLDVTPDHVVWRAAVAGGGRQGFVRADELSVGDTLSWHRTEAYGAGEIKAKEVAEAALAGWLQSDGFVGRYEGTNRSLTVEAMTVTAAELDWVIGNLQAVFPDVHRHERRVPTKDPARDCRRTRLYGNVLWDFVERWGLLTRGVDMVVPERMFTAPLPVVRAYLRSIFQAEGWVSLRDRSALIELDMICERLVRGLQALLARFGIFSRVRFKGDRRSDRKGCWSLSIRTLADRLAFHEEIGFIDPGKAAKLAASLKLDGHPSAARKRLQIERIERLGEMDVFDIQTESGEYLSGNLRVHNCFILSVEDSMRSILNWYTEEAIIFKGGSGSGVNLSRIRASQEPLAGGGTASGPVSFMRGADASAGTIKSGGKTRRAAKMVILDADHPDIEEFVWCKALEERKARVLAANGFDMDLDGKDSHSVQYQNANNSVRVTDEFMAAVVEDRDWNLVARTDGSVIKTMKARELFRGIAEAAWECADPGMQFDTTINRWHTAPNAGRINGSNPCFPGTARVHTDKGLVPFRELVARVNAGESFAVWSHDCTSPDSPREEVHLSEPDALMITGVNEIVRLRFDNGMVLRCTPGHRVFTANRGFVEAAELTEQDEVKVLDLAAPAVNADLGFPAPQGPDMDAAAFAATWGKRDPMRLPAAWTEELAHYLGWHVAGGMAPGVFTTTIYRSTDDRDEILPGHQELLLRVNDGRPIKISEQGNGTAQLRLGSRRFKRFLEALGVAGARGPEKTLPWSIEQAPPHIAAAFLRGLFDADGCVRLDRRKGSYVSLGSSSPALLQGVQRLLTTFGIAGTIYKVRDGADVGAFSYARKDDTTASHRQSAAWDLRVTSESAWRFAERIGFSLSRKQALLADLIGRSDRGPYKGKTTTRMVERAHDGVEPTYNLAEPRNHSYIVDGIVVRNCSEYMHLDNSSCNLASLNLLKFLNDDGTFDVEAFKDSVSVVFTGQEILVGNADYPTQRITENTKAYREIGIGYANLGALLMAQGLPYDSDGGRAWAGAITALLTGQGYVTSGRIAARMGPFAGYHGDMEAMQRVLGMHRDAIGGIDATQVPAELLEGAAEVWDTAVELCEQQGVRNSQCSVIAPTGTIGLLLDCDTTGLEPDLGLVKTKKLVGGGTMSIVNQTVPRALAKLGYSPEQAAEIVAYIDEHKSILGAPHLANEHLAVFACSMGDNTIHHLGHVRMMGAIQPFISGALSKTVNMPEDVTVEDVEQLHIEAWRLGIKAIAIYRDNCKVGQPLSTTKKGDEAAAAGTAGAPAVAAEGRDPALAAKVAELEKALEKHAVVVRTPVRERLPRHRRSLTFAFRVADCEGYVTVGEYEDGRPGEVFMKVSKQGSTLAGIMDAFSISVSLGLQHGVPLATFVRKYTNMRFEPAGITDDPELRIATSLADYIFRRLAVDYLSVEERMELGILTSEERMQPSLPGLEDAGMQSAGVVDAPGHAGAAAVGGAAGARHSGSGVPEGSVHPAARAQNRDAPYCYQCGNAMQRAGSCYVCPQCGTTSGCS